MKPGAATVIRMPRPPWKPKSEEQRAVIEELDEVAAKAQQVTEELWRVVEKARRLNVAKDEIARRAEPAASRATVYRRFRKAEQEADSED